jgi:hypothetical protein
MRPSALQSKSRKIFRTCLFDKARRGPLECRRDVTPQDSPARHAWARRARLSLGPVRARLQRSPRAGHLRHPDLLLRAKPRAVHDRAAALRVVARGFAVVGHVELGHELADVDRAAPVRVRVRDELGDLLLGGA